LYSKRTSSIGLLMLPEKNGVILDHADGIAAGPVAIDMAAIGCELGVAAGREEEGRGGHGPDRQDGGSV
jgi:hypothetical protein